MIPGPTTRTVVCTCDVLPAPEPTLWHASVYVVFVTGDTDMVPLTGFTEVPLMLQVEAPVQLQLRIELPGSVIWNGFAVNVQTGVIWLIVTVVFAELPGLFVSEHVIV